MGWGFSGIGSLLNDVTGVTSGARQSQKYALQSAQVNNAYQKEFAQNAHQWEMEDYRKSGLNPVLSAGGSGTGASGGGVSAGTASSAGINPIETAIGAWNGIEQAKNTGADTNRKNAETANEITKNENIQADTLLKKRQALQILVQNAHTEEDRKRIMAEIRKTDAEIKKIGTENENLKADTNLKNRTTGGTSHKGGGLDLPFGRVGISWDS